MTPDAEHISARPDYRQFRTRLARDLCWLLSPQFDLEMPDSEYSRLTINRNRSLVDWLKRIDETPPSLPLSPAQPPKYLRLGRYFEDLVAFYLEHNPAAPISQLQRNVPLRQPNTSGHGVDTLGELDFVYQQNPKTIHLEVAVKFYLGVEQDGQRLWLGPNRQDSLARKWQHLVLHQLPLGQRLARADLESQFCLKGILFEPWSAACISPPSSMRTHWIHLQQARAYFSCNPGAWQLLQKHQWLGGDYMDSTEQASEMRGFTDEKVVAELKQHFDHNQFGVMLMNQSSEYEQRCFVVADDWPKTMSV